MSIYLALVGKLRQVPISEIGFGVHLGRGSFGSVCAATVRSAPYRDFAIKRMGVDEEGDSIDMSPSRYDSIEDSMYTEIQTYRRLLRAEYAQN